MSRSIKKRPVEIPRPILYYNFDNSDDGYLTDLMGDRTSTIVGGVTTGVAGRLGQAIRFDGSTGYVSTPDDSSLQPHIGVAGTSTWSFVLKPEIISGSNAQTIISKCSDAGSNCEFVLSIRPTNTFIQLNVSDPTGTDVLIVKSDVAIPLNVYSHVAVTFDNSEISNIDKIKMFVNGRPAARSIPFTSGAYTQMSDTASPVRLGAWFSSGAPTDLYDGSLDELLWFDVVLTDAQIVELADRSLARKPGFSNVPVTDYDIWWSARNIDGEGNATFTGPNVSTLVDHGAFGLNATQGTTADQPLLRPFRDGFNPALNFDGSTDSLQTGASASMDTDTFTAFIVADSSADSTQMFLENEYTSGASSNSGIFWGSLAVVGGTSSFSRQSDGTFVSIADKVLPPYVSNSPVLITSEWKADDHLSQFNDITFSSTSSLLATAVPSGHISTGIGYRPDDNSLHLNGNIYEIIIFSRELTELERLSVQNFLAEVYPHLEFQQLVIATNPDTTVEDTPITFNVEAAGQYPEPAAYWSMDNADQILGTVVDPISGLNATEVNSPTYVGGQVGQALLTNAASDRHLSVADGSITDFGTDDYTLSFWTRITAADRVDNAKRNDNLNDPGWALIIAGGEIISVHCDGTGSRQLFTSTGLGIDDGEWHHILTSSDRSGSQTIYLDSVAVGTLTINTQPNSINNAFDMVIGAQYSGGVAGVFGNGEVDEFAIWRRALDANEVFEVYKRGAQGLKLVE